MSDAIAVTVIGAGLMGHGIAQVFAAAGHAVVLTDPDRQALASAPERVSRNLQDQGADPSPALRNLAVEERLGLAVAGADFIIECAPETLALKQDRFDEVARAAPAHAVLASNTSVIPISRIGERLAGDARRRLVGTHWWNPPHLIPLVEVVRTADTSDDVFEQTFAWLEQAGKRPVRVYRDVPGFIGNRLQHAMWREAFGLIEDGVCDAQTIDRVVKNSFGMRLPVLGPMENADLVGLELTREVHRVLFPDLKCNTTPSPLLDRLIERGLAGMKAGEGLMQWTPEQAAAVKRELAEHLLKMIDR